MIKKGILLLMAVPLLIGMVSCGQIASGSSDTNNAADVKEVRNDGHKPVMLTKAEFLSKVMNYEENPQEWKYLGEKPCLIDFYADWCGFCRKMANTTFKDAALINYLNDNFMPVRVNTDREPQTAGSYGVAGLPTTVFLTEMGEPIFSVPGYIPTLTLMSMLEEINGLKTGS